MTGLSRFLVIVCLAAGISLPVAGCGSVLAGETKTVSDQTGRSVVVPAKPGRIVSLIPSLTEIVFDLGRGDLLVGATQYAREPAAAAELPRVGSYLHLDVERIVALDPDLCLAVRDGNPEHLVRRIEQLGIPVFALDSQDIPDIIESIRLLGGLLHAEGRADLIIHEMQEKIDSVTQSVDPGGSSPGVFFQIDANPIVSAGHNTFIDRLISMAGGENLAGGNTTYPRYSWEDILVMKPEVVIIASMAGGYSEAQLKQAWTRWDNIPAVRSGRVYVVDANLFDRPVPRLADGLVMLHKLLHQEPGKR